MKVVYGHTDSIYVQIDSVETAETAIKVIEESVREHFPNVMGLKEHPIQLEFEKYYSALGVGVTKNRNAGLVSWEDGQWLDKPKFTMTGFTAKRVSESKLAKTIQTTALRMWVDQKSMVDINKYLNESYDSVLTGQVDKSAIIKRSRLRKKRFTVKCPECKRQCHLKDLNNTRVCGQEEGREGLHKCGNSVSNFTTLEGKRPTIGSGVAGVISAWQSTSATFDDSYLYLKVINYNNYINPLTKVTRRIEYMAGTTYADFEDCVPDYKHYAEQVVKKAEPIYKAMSWDISAIRTGRIQKSLEEWF